MHREILTASQIRVLDRLTVVPQVGDFYLAGGTALALRHGHRRSVDFDFFRDATLNGPGLLHEFQAVFPDLELIPTDPSALYVVLEGVTTSFFPYRYPQLAPGDPTPWQFDLASDDDIAAMKLRRSRGAAPERISSISASCAEQAIRSSACSTCSTGSSAPRGPAATTASGR